MTLDRGRHYLAIPGPSVIPDEVLAAMHRPAPNIYEGELIEMTASIARDLRAVARTAHPAAMYISNGHGAWEAALANVARPGDRVLVQASGRFGHGWATMARAMGLEVDLIEGPLDAAPDPGRIEAALRADPGHEIRAVLACHVDTSTGILTDPRGLRAAIDAAGHPALLMMDCIASLAVDRYEMDAWGVDVTVTGSQKGLMTPPGMAFVWIGPRAAEARARTAPSSYWDWRPRIEPDFYYENFCGTAPTHHLYGLRQSLDMLKAEGMEAIWARHETLAAAYWAAIGAWSAGGPMRINVPDPAHRSRAITSICLPGGQGEALRLWCSERLGLTLGLGIGREPRGDWFRIGHMGHLNAHMVMGVIGVIETGLVALDIPHGAGATAAAAEVIAGALRSGRQAAE